MTRNERARGIAVQVVACAFLAFVIGEAITGHYVPLLGALIAAPILAFIWWVTS